MVSIIRPYAAIAALSFGFCAIMCLITVDQYVREESLYTPMLSQFTNVTFSDTDCICVKLQDYECVKQRCIASLYFLIVENIYKGITVDIIQDVDIVNYNLVTTRGNTMNIGDYITIYIKTCCTSNTDLSVRLSFPSTFIVNVAAGILCFLFFATMIFSVKCIFVSFKIPCYSEPESVNPPSYTQHVYDTPVQV